MMELLSQESPILKNGIVKQKRNEPLSTSGQLGFGNFSDEALQKAVDRGWITQEQSDKISGKKDWFVNDVKIPDKESTADKQKRLAMEKADEDDAYDRKHKEGQYATIKNPGKQTKKKEPEKITSMSQLIPKSINQLKTMYKNTEDPKEKRLIRMALSQQGYKLRDDGKFKDTYKDKYKNR